MRPPLCLLILALLLAPSVSDARLVLRPRGHAARAAPAPADSALAARRDSLRAVLPAEIDRDYEVEWNEVQGCVIRLNLRDAPRDDRDCVPEALVDPGAAEEVQAFVANYATLLGMREEDELRLSEESSRTCGGLSQLVFSTRYRGVEVWDVRVNATVSRGGRLLAYDGGFARDLELDPTPEIGPGVARERVEALLEDRTVARVRFDELRFERFMGRIPWAMKERVTEPPIGWFLVWPMIVADREGATWIVRVDAHSGRVLTCMLAPPPGR